MQYKTDRNNISHSGCFRSGYKLTEIAPCKSMDLQGDFCFWTERKSHLRGGLGKDSACAEVGESKLGVN